MDNTTPAARNEIRRCIHTVQFAAHFLKSSDEAREFELGGGLDFSAFARVGFELAKQLPIEGYTFIARDDPDLYKPLGWCKERDRKVVFPHWIVIAIYREWADEQDATALKEHGFGAGVKVVPVFDIDME